ncbi:MAG TPA: methyl-accepting chemotaxis protein [Candidatus Acidoferrum sp.]|nr:methyl-accepting chemotaxis protein [Candidatus Acidoferrum sp.]
MQEERVIKRTSIWQRLNLALLLLILLLLAGVGLALWVAESRLAATQRIEQLSGADHRIRYDLLQVSESVCELLLDPKNQAELKQKREAEADLVATLNGIPYSYTNDAPLMTTVGRLRDFASQKLGGFNRQVLDTAESDAAAAIALYNRDYPELRAERRTLFAQLTAEIASLRGQESERAQALALLGLTPLVIILLAVPVMGRLHSWSFAQPLNRLAASLECMRQGDFTQRLTLERRDEFGVLSDGLNRLADDLSELVGQVQRWGLQVNATASEISATAKKQQGTAHEIAATTAGIGAASKQILLTSQELVKTMSEVNRVAEETADLAGSGQNSIAHMESTMRQIMEAASSISSKLAVLSEKTANINSVVTTITKVADQTNLLSLNAAIEAEKAGEYGLGFAVVAMEIRRLADQTGVATYDIEKMVKEMQSAVAAGVMGMDKFSEEVRRGVEQVRQVSTHLAQIIRQVQTLTPRFQQVNRAMHGQAAGAQQMNETLAQLGEAANETAESLRQSNLSIEQLHGAAQSLQTSVARFKLAR